MSNFDTSTEILYDEVDENHTVAIPEDLLEELEWRYFGMGVSRL